MRVLVLTSYPTADASRRLRVEPLIRELRSRGADVEVHELISDTSFRYKNGSRPQRLRAAIQLCSALMARVLLVRRRPDVLIVHREAFPFLTPRLERIFCRNSAVSLLDVDDAIYSAPTHVRDWRRFLRKPERALEYKNLFDVVACGNSNLMAAFSGGTAQVVSTPTCPPIEVRPAEDKRGAPINILWTGSQSTLGSLRGVLDDILMACEHVDAQLIVVGGANVAELPSNPRLAVYRWDDEVERQMLDAAHLGLMPLPDTEWERGKSGYKALLYLCAGLHVLVSPVGINQTLAEEYRSVRPVADGQWFQAVCDAVVNIRSLGLDYRVAGIAREQFDPRRVASRVVDELLTKAQQAGEAPR